MTNMTGYITTMALMFAASLLGDPVSASELSRAQIYDYPGYLAQAINV